MIHIYISVTLYAALLIISISATQYNRRIYLYVHTYIHVNMCANEYFWQMKFMRQRDDIETDNRAKPSKLARLP